MRRCSVPGCFSNYTRPYVSMFSFPKDPTLCKLWLKSIGRPTLKVHENIGVCVKHFEKHLICGNINSNVPRKKLSIKPGAVPTIFEDICSSDDNSKLEEKMKSVENYTHLIMDENKTPEKEEDDEDYEVEEEEEEEEEEDDDDDDYEDDCVIEMQSPGSKSASSASPFKNLPNVSVCLKEEDRVPITRELKGVKRSPSTGSNSSTGSSDAHKLNPTATKRRKIEKPAPVVIGRQNDCYCWVCHRENITLCCIACPRAYHPKCAGELSVITPDWVCPECQSILAAENVDTRSSTLAEISLDKLGTLLKLSLNKMKQRAPIAFHQPVSLEHYPLYLHYVIHPMDFSLLEKNINQKVYGCTEAFLADVKWISHNSCVFNGTQHPLSTNAKNLVKSCDQDMQEIEVCPDCFVHSVNRNKYWFSEVCRKPHPLVWAKLKGFPYWPAKVVRIMNGNVDARFFGAHDRAWVPVPQCYHLSKEMPTTSKPKKKGNYEVALDELNVHVHTLNQKFGSFEYAPYRTNFNPSNKALMYHGIDIDRVSKEEISFDTSSVSEKFHSSEKENRFANFLESEQEKLTSEENQLKKEVKSPLESNIGLKSPFLFTDRKSTDSVQSSKETDDDEMNHEKSTPENKTSNQISAVEEKKKDVSEVSPLKLSDKVSASDQFRKLELALERIKGYVSLNSEPEKESNEPPNKDNIEESKNLENKTVSEENANKDETEKSTTSSSFFKETISLSAIETDSAQESNIDVTKSLETTKKTDSFFLKLNETIESCKAKLGISEITDDLSDESIADENASRSDEDEDEEDNTSASEAEELSSDEEVEDEEDEEEVIEVSDEELENEDEENELDDKGERSMDESGEESNSESSDTDIENHARDSSPNKSTKSYALDSEDSKNEEAATLTNEGTCKVADAAINETVAASNETRLEEPDKQVPEETLRDSDGLEEGEISSSEIFTEGSSDMKEVSSKGLLNETTVNQSITSTNVGHSATFSSKHGVETVFSKDDSSSILIEENTNKSIPVSKISDKGDSKTVQNVEKNSGVQALNDLSQKDNEEQQSVQSSADVKQKEIKEDSLSLHCKNEPADEDDDIYICTPTRPKSPPVIVLDDDAEIDDSSVSDTYAIKLPPYSTSIESFSNEENPACSTNSGDEQGDSPSKMSVNGRPSDKKFHKGSTPEVKGAESLVPDESRKRKLSTEDTSDDDIQIVQPVKKAALTGARRTFNKPNNVDAVKRVSPTLESVRRNLVKGLEKVNTTSPVSQPSETETEFLRPESASPIQSPQLTPKSPVIDTSNMSDHEKEILFLKRKLSCLMTAYKIQGWKCNQEREEVRHNMNLIIMEMRACFETDKKQAVDALVKKFEKEKLKSVEEAKRKQWCANCLTESRYACCWNTSYCSIDCQKKHFLEHRNSCSQIKSKGLDEIKSNSTPSMPGEKNENKRVIIVNMKAAEPGKTAVDKTITPASQQIPSHKPEIQILASASKNNPQSSSSTSTSNPVQFVLAPVKTPSESKVATSESMDSAQIISHVRSRACDLGTAISLLKKKNLESNLALAKKKEQSQKEEASKEDSNLEEVYFPSPPKVTFEGYDSANPDPNSAADKAEEAKMDSFSEDDTSESPEDLSPKPDGVLSGNKDVRDKMVSLGHGIDIKGKFLKKCLKYGKTTEKLTRCLVDVMFPDIKLLASCTAFGQKSNITKLTRAALPHRKVKAIIDFVKSNFAQASRSDIIHAINVKCEEARHVLNKIDFDMPNQISVKKLLVREQEDDGEATVVTTSSPTIIAPVTSTKSSPNVVCVKSSTQSQPMTLNLPKKPVTVPNIMHCSSQLLVNSKLTQIGNAAVLQTLPQRKKSQTVKQLLSINKHLLAENASKDGPQVVESATNTRPTNARPYIIIGSPINTVNQSTAVQNSTVAASSDHNK